MCLSIIGKRTARDGGIRQPSMERHLGIAEEEVAKRMCTFWRTALEKKGLPDGWH